MKYFAFVLITLILVAAFLMDINSLIQEKNREIERLESKLQIYESNLPNFSY